ncbi:TonB family protein [Hymenobacter sp. RP-2-7]|uniref:TonB family protein n=1 Tax=Hymenobacter polaris TaxID=2682546 RepID=A0A7Y0AF11_9BACT|nr:M56 family metallopeptidase [Hymenobacter polaris]NML66143.1 TonB family protein [Hymenobacter polaris]
MNYTNWLLWLGGTLLPLGLLWALWRLALRPERCYGYNRALLLLAPVLAAALPLLPRPALPAWLAGAVATSSPVAAVTLPVLPVGATAPHAAVVASGWWLLGLYAAGLALGLGRLAWQTGRLWRLARRLPRFELGDYALVQTGGRLPTSTFGRVVFWDETTALAPAEATAVLAHELAHVHQRHTLDVLWLQLWRAVLWPNPFVHLLLPALRLTHELLADQAAATVPTGPFPLPAAPANSADSYATLLARLAARQLAGPAYSLLQPFAFSSTLTRIAMLQNQFPVRRWKQWLVLPVVAAVALVACQKTNEPVAPLSKEARFTSLKANVMEAIRQDSLRNGNQGWRDPNLQLNIDKDGNVTITHRAPSTAVLIPELPGGGGAEAIVAAIQHNIAYPKGSAPPAPGNRSFVRFVVGADGKAQQIKVIKSVGPAYDAALVAAIQQLPRFAPAQKAGQPVPFDLTVPVQFAVQP